MPSDDGDDVVDSMDMAPGDEALAVEVEADDLDEESISDSSAIELDDSDSGDNSGNSEFAEEDAGPILLSVPGEIPDLGSIYNDFEGQQRQKRSSNYCGACGEPGHYATGCRKRDVEYILARMNIIPKIPKTFGSTSKLDTSRNVSVSLEPTNVGNAPLVLDTTSKVLTKHRNQISPLSATDGNLVKAGSISVRQKRSRSASAQGTTLCIVCGLDSDGMDNWRLFGQKCEHCNEFMHFDCAPTPSKGSYNVCQPCSSLKK